MFKIFFLFLFVAMAACNNQASDTASKNGTTQDTVIKKSFKWPAGEERDFLAGCVDNAKARLGDTAAYSYCNCVLAQVKQTYPNMDSASAVLMDSATVVKYAGNCK